MKKIIFLSILSSLLFLGKAYAISNQVISRSTLFDLLLFQFNLGASSFHLSDASTSVFLPNTPVTSSLTSHGLHAALNVTDFKCISKDLMIGGRFGGQLFSNLKGEYNTPAFVTNTVQHYDLKRKKGIFTDVILEKLWENQAHLDLFAGIGYDQYVLEGSITPASGLSYSIRCDKQWIFYPRVGVGAGRFVFNKFTTLGLEYTHDFDMNKTFSATGSAPNDNRSHSIKSSTDTIDLTFRVIMG